MRSFPTRSVLAGACTLALIGGTAATLSPVNAAPPATSNTVQGGSSSLPGNNNNNDNANDNSDNVQQTKITSVEGGPLNPITGENTLTITGEGIDPNQTFESLQAEVYELDADGDRTGKNLAQDDAKLTVTEDGHFSGTAKVKGNFDPQKRYAVFAVIYSGHGYHTVEARQDLPVQQVDEKNVHPSVTVTPDFAWNNTFYRHLNTNTLTVRGTRQEGATRLIIRVEALDENGKVTETLVTKDASADLNGGNFTTKVQVPGSKIESGKRYQVVVETGANDWSRAEVEDFRGDTESEAIGIVDGAPLSRSAAENRLKVAGGGFDPATAAQNGSKVRLIFAEYDVENDIIRDDEIVNTTVTPKPNGDFESELTIPGNKLQAGKKYVVRAYLEDADGRVSSDITLKTLVPTKE